MLNNAICWSAGHPYLESVGERQEAHKDLGTHCRGDVFLTHALAFKVLKL